MASSFSRSRSMPLTAPLTASKVGRKPRSSDACAKARRRRSSPSSSNRTVSDDRERAPAVGRVGEQRHRPEVAARAVAEHQHLLARDVPRGVQLTLEHDVEGRRAVALAEEELARRHAALAAQGGEPHELLVAEGGEDRDAAQAVDAHGSRL